MRLLIHVSISSPVADVRDLHSPFSIFLGGGIQALRAAGLIDADGGGYFADMHLTAANPRRFKTEWEKREQETAGR